MNKKWIKQVRIFLDAESTSHLHLRSLKTKDEEELKILLQIAKKIIATEISMADQLINYKKDE